jgi:hypothetical protein
MIAHHIIGLSALELGRWAYDPSPEQKEEIRSATQQRFEQILEMGYLQARRDLPADNPDRSTWEDNLAGDDRYIFLSVGARYLDQIEGAAYGFVFDAEDLIRQGAILGLHDLASRYTEIIGEAAEEVAATLPRLPRIAEAELDEFMALMGESDPAMRQFISDESLNPESELIDALSDGNAAYPGYSQCVALIQQRIAALHAEKRLQGDAALAYLQQHGEPNGAMEILVPDRLPLAWATGYIRAGKVEMLKEIILDIRHRAGKPIGATATYANGVYADSFRLSQEEIKGLQPGQQWRGYRIKRIK